MTVSDERSVPALRVRQWLDQWEKVTFDPAQNQSRPQEHFYVFSLPASKLRSLAGIYRRSTDGMTARKDDLNIQRKHDPERSAEIRRYVEGGYPWSGLSESKRIRPDSDSLRKPGWLPTAVVVNFLKPGDQRMGRVAKADQVILVDDNDQTNMASLTLPEFYGAEELPPIEVIDGQHRLFAFDDDDADVKDYHLPVVAFHGLDISWQAYLFWTINIKPKKINPSLAFDLYPLLREQEWLDSGEVVQVYRESRAQELTEILWSTPTSPWHRRINMLGGSRKENGPVTQASFIRSLTASMVKSWRPTRGTGGIFGGTPNSSEGLAWTRSQQSAFLLLAWTHLAEKIRESQHQWALSVRAEAAQLSLQLEENILLHDPAFTSASSLLATDQGVRGFQAVLNDLFYLHQHDLQLARWSVDADSQDVNPENVQQIADSFRDLPAFKFLDELCVTLASFDWRSSSAADLSETSRRERAALRGSGGYKELRKLLANHLRQNALGQIKSTAQFLGR